MKWCAILATTVHRLSCCCTSKQMAKKACSLQAHTLFLFSSFSFVAESCGHTNATRVCTRRSAEPCNCTYHCSYCLSVLLIVANNIHFTTKLQLTKLQCNYHAKYSVYITKVQFIVQNFTVESLSSIRTAQSPLQTGHLPWRHTG